MNKQLNKTGSRKSSLGLQKFTDIETKINSLLKLEKLKYSDLVEFTADSELKRLSEVLTQKINTLEGIEKDQFYNKIEDIVDVSTKNDIWERNHNSITCAISTLLQEYGRMPSKTEIAIRAGLSRTTVHKHLGEYTSNSLYLDQIEQFRFMTSKVLSKVFQFAVNGDMAAAKLYFNVVGNSMIPGATLIQNQNNYIQVNNTVINQESIKHLSTDQLNAIESFLKDMLPQPEKLPIELKENNKTNLEPLEGFSKVITRAKNVI